MGTDSCNCRKELSGVMGIGLELIRRAVQGVLEGSVNTCQEHVVALF